MSVKAFTIIKFLGKGSYGSVNSVRRIADGKMYALKEINIKPMSHSEREDAVNEIRILASFKHPNIIRYREAFVENDKLYIVTEYADEGDLLNKIKQAKTLRRYFSEEAIWTYFLQICKAISFLHSKNVLHRDIKCANMFLSAGRVIKVGDLGVAKLLTNSEPLARTSIGTPYYISPEIWNHKPYGPKSDVWSLGCVLYELCTLQRPFEGFSMSALSKNVREGHYKALPPFYSKEIRSIVDSCLHVDPKSRPSVAQILALPISIEKIFQLKIDHLAEIRKQKERQQLLQAAQQAGVTTASDDDGMVDEKEYDRRNKEAYDIQQQIIINSNPNTPMSGGPPQFDLKPTIIIPRVAIVNLKKGLKLPGSEYHDANIKQLNMNAAALGNNNQNNKKPLSTRNIRTADDGDMRKRADSQPNPPLSARPSTSASQQQQQNARVVKNSYFGQVPQQQRPSNFPSNNNNNNNPTKQPISSRVVPTAGLAVKRPASADLPTTSAKAVLSRLSVKIGYNQNQIQNQNQNQNEDPVKQFKPLSYGYAPRAFKPSFQIPSVIFPKSVLTKPPIAQQVNNIRPMSGIDNKKQG
ncbi:MAG: putative G2-specific protein kinase nimA [Streblomastix strix]|uniref:non-specific serine/threonine protein kinase n=1 Tax=Streblomastix strix TaxID=222440 RepID=A0A5J4V4X8_9EUKA|nr:MAG: putative G2-specific protein kinase nimA [Streblomastix strix]